MKKLMWIIAVISLAAVAVTILLYLYFPAGWLLSLAITCGTIAYHFWMRIVVAVPVALAMRGKTSCHKAWFQPHSFETKLYRFLRVHRWKRWVPTYEPSQFSVQERTLAEIVQGMCQAEVCHEVIVVCSFLPLLAALLFGEFWVFFGTSLAAALFDLQFVILQRYNRPRVLRLAERERRRAQRP